jgi:hypothetical protein
MNADLKGPVPNNPSSNLYSVDVIGQFDAEKRVAGAGTFQPVLLGQIYLTVAGSTITNCEGTQNYPVVICSAEGGESKIYLPGGLRGGFHPADAAPSPDNQCVRLAAWKGEKGPTGNQGPQGPQGPPAEVIVNPGPIVIVPTGPGPFPSPKFSDLATKATVQNFDYGLKELLQIRPVTFAYNGLAGTSAGEHHVGVIAQELEVVAPNLVEKVNVKLRPTDPYASEVRRVYYDRITTMLLKSVEEQQEQINQLSRELNQLQTEMNRERAGRQK